MVSVDRVCQCLAEIAPLRLAESWDNVGLLVGDRKCEASRIMTCLTISPLVVDEAVDENVHMVVTHHPLPFKPFSRITSDTIAGSMLLRLIRAGVAIYSAHTAFDSAAAGINQQWADQLGLCDVRPLVDLELDGNPANPDPTNLGSGRYGTLVEKESLSEFASRVSKLVSGDHWRCVGSFNRPVRRCAFACGSGGSFLAAAHRKGCDTMVTGEATFHTCLEAESLGISLILIGHYQSERFAMQRLAEQLAAEFPESNVWPSRRESDPISIGISDSLN
ncbi:GTP cyclohydrolase 1 type 2 [Planctomycetes bacterium CA13]|uniref:GTP cyclohydrolase 1 type 2 homolog n=1 Tax=Novipirellula herctigrandis TaxID=2527986 RepID=A0A5C5YWP2_9BACT|nr:GTP cyclohydrolase 1 type 2 [Planctomycetes bacterium CA13]